MNQPRKSDGKFASKQMDLTQTADQAPLVLDGVQFADMTLIIAERLDFDNATVLGKWLERVDSSHAFWRGDFLNYAETMFGEAYAQLVPEVDANTLRGWKWVSEKVKPQNRRGELKWSHHELVSAMEDDKQIHYLTMAVNDKLSVNALRKKIREDTGTLPKAKTTKHICPECGHEWQDGDPPKETEV